ncbi:MAG: S-methyl-5-thioribose-1-phosphate isomerase [Lachnospiraceae bacterium]|nr:S-methyl-5-thioribose-1-phosphate isomerase [Lachnospiraceae bacterium]
MKTGLTYDTVALNEAGDALLIIDQTKLPNEEVILALKTQKEIHDAIYLLQVRGAPAIGVAAAYGVYLAAREMDTQDYDTFAKQFHDAAAYLNSARPTAVNLSWALRRMEDVVAEAKNCSVAKIKELLKKEAEEIQEEDINICRMIGEYGLTLIKKGDGLLTHCNAGQLATSRYGTATAPMYLAHEKGYGIHVFADETRPLLQGARLTAYELNKAGIDVTLICDNMASMVMRQGKVQAVFVGCDRVAMNGDAANKIGTSQVAILAKHYGIPFYVCAPSSTIDENLTDGSQIPIEERPGEEICSMWYEKRMTPEGVKTYNPAFDVTDHTLISAIITENGIARAPYETSLRKMLEGKKGHKMQAE